MKTTYNRKVKVEVGNDLNEFLNMNPLKDSTDENEYNLKPLSSSFEFNQTFSSPNSPIVPTMDLFTPLSPLNNFLKSSTDGSQKNILNTSNTTASLENFLNPPSSVITPITTQVNEITSIKKPPLRFNVPSQHINFVSNVNLSNQNVEMRRNVNIKIQTRSRTSQQQQMNGRNGNNNNGSVNMVRFPSNNNRYGFGLRRNNYLNDVEMNDVQNPQSPSKIISLIEGFTRPPKTDESYFGGRSNYKHTLPVQILELKAEGLPVQMCDPSKYSCRVFVIGHKNGDEKVLGKISERRFEYKKINSRRRWVCYYDSLICKHSSHKNGGKLTLRFCLLNPNRKEVCSIDSKGFITITQRGLDKKKKRKRVEISENACITHVSPEYGLTTGGGLVKIYGEGFSNVNPAKVKIKFGRKYAKEIYAIKRNVIICETPKSEEGKVDVLITLDTVTFLESEAQFTFVSPNDRKGVEQMVTSLMLCKDS